MKKREGSILFNNLIGYITKKPQIILVSRITLPDVWTICNATNHMIMPNNHHRFVTSAS